MFTYKISQFLYSIISSVIGGKGFSKYKIIRKGKKFAENNIHSSSHSDNVLYSFHEYPFCTHVQEHEMYLDPSDSLRLSTNGVFEPYTTEVIKQNISNGDLVMDIGANIGYFTLIMAKGIRENGKVFSFEPEPKNFELLKKNVEINNYSNVILEKKAIGNKTGIAKLYLADKKDNIFYSGLHRIFRSDLVSQISNPISINIIKLDDYLQDLKSIKKIRLIKIDVEGAEFDVLKGMSKILDGNKEIKIVMEFSSENLKDYGSNPSDVMDFLINKGFKLSIINEVEKRMEEVTGIKGIIDSEAKKIGLNIFCSR